MSDTEIDNKRRRFLIKATSAVGTVGLGAIVIPFISSLTPKCSRLSRYRPEVAAADLGADWAGGFYCPCHGSRFDLAGRVMKGSPAGTNMTVPPHYYKTDEIVRIGEDDAVA